MTGTQQLNIAQAAPVCPVCCDSVSMHAPMHALGGPRDTYECTFCDLRASAPAIVVMAALRAEALRLRGAHLPGAGGELVSLNRRIRTLVEDLREAGHACGTSAAQAWADFEDRAAAVHEGKMAGLLAAAQLVERLTPEISASESSL